jgi:hypothetical protein
MKAFPQWHLASIGSSNFRSNNVLYRYYGLYYTPLIFRGRIKSDIGAAGINAINYPPYINGVKSSDTALMRQDGYEVKPSYATFGQTFSRIYWENGIRKAMVNNKQTWDTRFTTLDSANIVLFRQSDGVLAFMAQVERLAGDSAVITYIPWKADSTKQYNVYKYIGNRIL